MSTSASKSDLRRSSRQKIPSTLYASGFENIDKVMSKKSKGTKTTPKAESKPKAKSDKIVEEKKSNNRKSSKIEEEKLSEHTKSPLKSKSAVSDDEVETQDEISKMRIVNPKYTDDDGDGSGSAAGYAIRKRKKPASHKDYVYNSDYNKKKAAVQKPQPVTTKKKSTPAKPTTPTPQSTGSESFLDMVLSAAINAQANRKNKQSPAKASISKAPPKLDIENGKDSPKQPLNFNGNSALTKRTSSQHQQIVQEEKQQKESHKESSQQQSTPKVRKNKIKKTNPPPQPAVEEEEPVQKRTEYAEHYIKKVEKNGDKVILNHTKEEPVEMQYTSKKFQIKKKELIDSKIFDLQDGEFSYGQNDTKENSEQNDREWKKKLKIKENILQLHFKEALANYKPRILLQTEQQQIVASK